MVLAAILIWGVSGVLRTWAGGMTWTNEGTHILIEICGLLLTMGIIYCLWTQYRVSCERWLLLATSAFVILLLGRIIHALVFAVGPDVYQPVNRFGLQCLWVSSFVAGALLWYGAGTTAVDSKELTRRTGMRLITDIVLLVLCLIVLLLKVASDWERILSLLPQLTASALQYIAQWSHSSFLTNTLVLAILIPGFAACTRRHLREEDAFSDGISRFLLLLIGAQAATLLSVAEHDLNWWASHVYAFAALVVVLLKLGAEFGASYADAHSRVKHLEAVHYVSSRLTNTLDLRVVLLALVSDAADMLSAKFATIMLADDEGEHLTKAAVHGLPEEPLDPATPQPLNGSGRPAFYSGHTARAFREKRVVVVDDVYTDVEFVPWRLLARYDGYAVSVPLVYQDISLGVMNLFFEKHIALNDERIRLFQTLASSATTAIINAQLYDRTVQAGAGEFSWLHGYRLAS